MEGSRKKTGIISILFLIALVVMAGLYFIYGSGTPSEEKALNESAALLRSDGLQEDEDDVVLESPNEEYDESIQKSEGIDTYDYVLYSFRSEKYLNEHYEKHGIEMGFDSAASYERAASDVINNPAALYKVEEEDGDGVYYIEETNEFVILSTDGYIRTYFLPSAGKAYFDRQ